MPKLHHLHHAHTDDAFQPRRLPIGPIAHALSHGSPPDLPFDACCGTAPSDTDVARQGGVRVRLADLDPHLHCSVIGTCCSTAQLGKLLGRFVDVQGWDELAIHHEAVRLAAQGGEPAKQIHKALDRRYAATIQAFAQAKDEASLLALWKQHLKAGEVPGAYWAVLTHRRCTEAVRQQAFGDVHMLSHLVGAANRADIRRLVALERENNEMREHLERNQLRHAEVVQERDAALQSLADKQAFVQGLQNAADRSAPERIQALEHKLRGQTRALEDEQDRRQALERSAGVSRLEALRLADELQQLRAHADEIAQELAATEQHVRALSGSQADDSLALQRLRGQRLLYVGGRPSSLPAVRSLVESAGGEFRRHDGGIEDRKGLLGAALAWANLVVFPVDCVDHDSALALKRDCKRQGRPYLPLRSASVTSLVAALSQEAPALAASAAPASRCLRHA